jgi:RNA-binding protein YlmH
MEKKERIEKLSEDRDEQILLAHVYDKLSAGSSRNVPVSTCFLTKREQLLAEKLLPELPLRFFGGASDAERAVCCWLPDYLDEEWLSSEDGPVAAVRARFFEKDELSHRDFLGALMGSGIKRETVGDIYPGAGSCDFFVTREILPYVLQNLESAGRTKLSLQKIPLTDVQKPQQQVKTIRDTVSSLRLDGVVSSGFGLSRGKAAQAVESGKLELNYLVCQKPDKTVAEGDVISVRGLGKIRLESVGGTTKKGRIGIVISRFI